MNRSERQELDKWVEIIIEKGKEYGLDFFPIHFEVVPDHIIYEMGSYGLPARFSHWTFGRDYHIQKTMYEYGLSKIYEIVFNTDPCQAFLLESNSMLAHKFVAAHVLGHDDFFKNNTYFEHTDRKMIEKARLHANRIRKYEEEHGVEKVENLLDAALTIEYHFDTGLTTGFRKKTISEERRLVQNRTSTEYDDLWDIKTPPISSASPNKKIPVESEYDLLGFIHDYAPELENWERDILNMIREEMIYFIPQMRTKIINEGWASFWHERILTNIDLTPEEHLEFRRMHASVLSPGSKMSINPYYVGYNIFRDIERRWNGQTNSDYDETDWRGEKLTRPDNEGLKKIFEVRQEDSDVSFLRKYLTDSLVHRLDMYVYEKKEVDDEQLWVVQDTNWRKVRDTLLTSMTNFGIPIITVEDGDYKKKGELLLKHAHEGKDIDEESTRNVLIYIYYLWKRPVCLQTRQEDKLILIRYDGMKYTKEDWQ